MKINRMLENLRRELILWESLAFDLMKFVEVLDINILNEFESEKVKGFRKLYDYLVDDDKKRKEAENEERAKESAPIFFVKKGEKIEQLNFTIRTQSSLKQAGIRYISQLCLYTEAELLNFRNLGLKSLREIKNRLKIRNLKLR